LAKGERRQKVFLFFQVTIKLYRTLAYFLSADTHTKKYSPVCDELRQVHDKIAACREIYDSSRSQNVLLAIVGARARLIQLE